MVCQIYARLPDQFFWQKMRHKMRECAVLALLCYAVDVVVPKTQTDGRKNSNTENRTKAKAVSESFHHIMRLVITYLYQITRWTMTYL